VVVTVRTLGFERLVCESCGHVDFRAIDESPEPGPEVDRAIFARPGDLGADQAAGKHKAGG
jgi:hypothetical protein